MTMKKLKLISKYENEMDVVEQDPYNNYQQALIYLVVDWENATADIITKYKDGTYSMRSHLGFESYYNLPGDINVIRFQDEWENSNIKEMLEQLLNHWCEKWNGSSYIGQFNDRATWELDERVYDLIDNLSCVENMGIWDFWEWYYNGEEDLPSNYEEMTLDEIVQDMVNCAKYDYVIVKYSENTINDELQELLDKV